MDSTLIFRPLHAQPLERSKNGSIWRLEPKTSHFSTCLPSACEGGYKKTSSPPLAVSADDVYRRIIPQNPTIMCQSPCERTNVYIPRGGHIWPPRGSRPPPWKVKIIHFRMVVGVPICCLEVSQARSGHGTRERSWEDISNPPYHPVESG